MHAPFINFTKFIWIQEITNNELGISIEEKERESLLLEETYLKLKNKYDNCLSEQLISLLNISKTKSKISNKELYQNRIETFVILFLYNTLITMRLALKYL